LKQITLVISLLLFWASAGAGAQDDTGALIVRVYNGTADGRSVVGDGVTVSIYSHGELLTALQGAVGPNDAAVFEDVPTGQHIYAVAQVMHEQMRFGGHSVALSSGQTRDTVHVFDVAYEQSSLSATVHHLMITRKGDLLEVSEFIQIENASDMAVSSSQRDGEGRAVVLSVPLMKGYKDFKSTGYLVPTALGFTRDGFYDTMAMPPGKHDIKFSYTVKIKSNKMTLSKEVSLPTASLVVFSQKMRQGLTGLGEPDGSVILTDGTPAEFYSLKKLPAGANVKFTLSGLSSSPVSRGTWVVLAVAFCVAGGLAVTRLAPGKRQSANGVVSG
jgi:hypothetical protein